MNVTHPISEKLVELIKARDGRAISVAEMLGLGPRAAVDQALSRLVRQGTICRVGRGLYAWPRYSTLLDQPVVPSPDDLALAWARQHGLRVIPSGAYAANLLGLSTQVPAKITYYTNGRTQTVRLGDHTVKFLNRGPKTMNVTGRLTPHVFQALRYLRANGVTPYVIARLRRVLEPKDKADLVRNLRRAPGWMKPILEQIAQEEAN